MKRIVVNLLAAFVIATNVVSAANLSNNNTPVVTYSTQLPTNLDHKGKVKQVATWSYTDGKFIAFITETGIYSTYSKEYNDTTDNAELYAYLYRFDEQTKSYQQVWRIYDFSKDCPVDVGAKFLDGTFRVTDIDGNGTSEVWVAYTTFCKGDVSPSSMKVIMYEGKTKYAMRGNTLVQAGEDQYYGGDFEFDSNFKNSKKEFRNYARKMWRENMVEMSWDEE